MDTGYMARVVSATDHLKENFVFKIFRKFCHSLYKVNDLLILQSKIFLVI